MIASIPQLQSAPKFYLAKIKLIKQKQRENCKKNYDILVRIPLKLPSSVSIILYHTVFVELIPTRRNIPVTMVGAPLK
jgi:hypothetical protein